ncbi:MAG: NifB/NifX family molybdenum-iron cluster-binding protein [Candidatus Margulisiibacteriota bacterium]
MKICIPTKTNKGKEALVHDHFGSAPFFTIYDTENDSIKTIGNAEEHHSHGMCQPMSHLTGENIEVVVCGGMGARAVQKLNDGGIKAYKVIPGTVAEVISQFTKGGLEEITLAGACDQHHCH